MAPLEDLALRMAIAFKQGQGPKCALPGHPYFPTASKANAWGPWPQAPGASPVGGNGGLSRVRQADGVPTRHGPFRAIRDCVRVGISGEGELLTGWPVDPIARCKPGPLGPGQGALVFDILPDDGDRRAPSPRRGWEVECRSAGSSDLPQRSKGDCVGDTSDAVRCGSRRRKRGLIGSARMCALSPSDPPAGHSDPLSMSQSESKTI